MVVLVMIVLVFSDKSFPIIFSSVKMFSYKIKPSAELILSMILDYGIMQFKA